MRNRRSLFSLCPAALLLAFVASPRAGAADRPNLHHQDRPEASPILSEYDFEEPSSSGPDTFWVRQHGDSEVALSNAFRVSGNRSLHISEVPGNRDFAEFLAYFRECRRGTVFIQFYLLLTDPEQRFNFGLAGPGWFLNMERGGHAIWLQTDDGVFRQLTGGQGGGESRSWQQLFAPRPFAWYFIDFVYRVEAGTYDLAIFEEGLDDPVIDLEGVTGVNGHSRSPVKYFSLIGDLEDAGRFDFFVDDLIIATDPAVRQRPFVAPGRRRTFVERLPVTPRQKLTDHERFDLLWEARYWLDDVTQDTPPADLDRLESAGDEAFLDGEIDLAEAIYERLSDFASRRARNLLKLADVKHGRGDVKGERELREMFYGRLAYEDGGD
ncbi:MAG: hypothetical protein ACE5GX_17855 [Thermoanaerobaculia bacterium]